VTSLGVRAPSGRDWRKNGLKMVAIGLGAAAVGLLIGCLFQTT
jgi:VIT1/CCC1 family predicted Fe2+/Mn2+ transporter